MTAPIPTLSPVGDTLRSLLLEQYKDKARMEGILAQIGVEADMLDDANHELWNLYDLARAVGAQLDLLGVIAGESRSGKTDSAYRARLQVLFHTSNSGTPENIIRAVKEYTGATSVGYLPEYPAAVWLVLPPTAYLPPVKFLEILPAGVSGHVATGLAVEDDNDPPYPEILLLEDTLDGIMIEYYGTADVGPAPDLGSYTFTVSEDPLVAGAAVNISADALVAITDDGVVLADAILGLQAVGVALASAAPGGSVTILQFGTTGPFTVVPTVGDALYLGESGRWVTAPPAGAVISQRTGTAAALPGGGVGASISIHQPVWL